MSERVLVTGATGALGPTVIDALLAAGFCVRALCRRQPAANLLPTPVEIMLGDITDVATLMQAARGCHYIVHMAALLHIVNPPPDLQGCYEAINVQGTRNVVNAALANNVQRLLFFSTIAVYGHGRSETITEETVPQPDSFYGKSKLSAETLVLEARQSDGMPLGVVLRLAAVYGVGIKGNYARLYHALARGTFLPIGHGANRRTLVHDHDVAAATVLALRHPNAAGNIYNVTDGTVHTLTAIIEAISKALHRRPPLLYLPVAPIRWAIALLGSCYKVLRRTTPISQATLDKYLEEMAVDGCRLQQELGFVPHYSLTDGWQQVANRLRQK